MLPERLLRSLGLFVRREFLTREESARITHEMTRSAKQSATASVKDDVREDVRSASLCDVPNETVELVRSRLESLIAELEKYFDLQLSGVQPLNFLEYGVGGHHVAHRDASTSPPYDTRKVSFSILLQDERDDPDEAAFSGGTLLFYGLIGDEDAGLLVRAEAGVLVAFRSTVVHEVKPVLAGTRHSIVTWMT